MEQPLLIIKWLKRFITVDNRLIAGKGIVWKREVFYREVNAIIIIDLVSFLFLYTYTCGL